MDANAMSTSPMKNEMIFDPRGLGIAKKYAGSICLLTKYVSGRLSIYGKSIPHLYGEIIVYSHGSGKPPRVRVQVGILLPIHNPYPKRTYRGYVHIAPAL